MIVVVVDASNLQRNLYYATQVIELGYPTLIALNMVDVAEANGHQIDAGETGRGTRRAGAAAGGQHRPGAAGTAAGDPVARSRRRAGPSRASSPSCPPRSRRRPTPSPALLAQTFRERRAQAAAEALLILSNEKALASSLQHYPAPIQEAVVRRPRAASKPPGIDWRGATIEGRYLGVAAIQRAVTTELAPPGETFSDKLDRVLTHKVWGTLIFLAIMTLMFQSIFTFARIPMDALQSGRGLARPRRRRPDSARAT